MQRKLDNGLILMSLDEMPEDEHRVLGQFYVNTFDDEDKDLIGNWGNDLVNGHPTCKPEYVFVVIDPELDRPIDDGGKVVSALLVIPQTWIYNGEIELTVGRVEIVATHPDYRRRGLVRLLMNEAHALCNELGCLLTGITGIPTYYRMFGYAMAVDLGVGVTLAPAHIPKAKDDHVTQYTLRPATYDDTETLHQLDVYRASQDSALSHIRTPELWRYEIDGRGEIPFTLDLQMIVDKDGETVGYIAPHFNDHYNELQVYSWVIGDQSSYLATYEDTLRGLKAMIDERYADNPDNYPLHISFDLGLHPTLKEALGGHLGRVAPRNYAWYIRVPDFPRLFKHIAPVLERRLRGSGANCYTGTLLIGFANLNGVELTFESGKLTDVKTKEIGQWDADASFPFDLFMSVLFGHRNYQEIQYITPDTMANIKARVLLSTLFPKQQSWLYPLP